MTPDPDDEKWEACSHLLNVLLAAQEPLPLSMLASIKLRHALNHLPPGLFFPRGYMVHMLHKSVSDWLLDRSAAGEYEADLTDGHSRLAAHLMGQVGEGWM